MNRKWLLLIVTGIIFIILLAGIMVLLKKPEPRHVKRAETPSMSQPENTNPVFRKDGVLSFMDGKTSQVITKIDIEIADNENARIQGLMYRDSLPANAGMLFLMEYEEPQAFWMKNTHIPLDILYVNSEYKIVKIWRDTKPYSLETIPSGEPALYVVEVNAGFSNRFGLKEGDRIVF